MKINEFFDNAKRVFLVGKKPTKEEYWNLVKVTGLGIAILGIIGFLIILIVRLLYSPI